jgi:cell division protein FtsW (lipid II flippase)
VGVVAMYVASKMPVLFYRRTSWILMIASLLLLVLVLFIGVTVNKAKHHLESYSGNRLNSFFIPKTKI